MYFHYLIVCDRENKAEIKCLPVMNAEHIDDMTNTQFFTVLDLL